jgi:hypothetical protein
MGTPKEHFFGLSLMLLAVKILEGFTHIVEQAVGLGGFNDDTIDIHLDIVTELFLQASLHAPLIGGSYVLQAERHRHIAVDPVRGDECGLLFVFDLQPYLVVS